MNGDTALIWIDKPWIRLVVVPGRPWPPVWLTTFVRRQDALACAGFSQKRQPCRRPVYRWHFTWHHSTPFPAYCGLHVKKQPPEERGEWQVRHTERRLPCPCGCGAEVPLAEAALVPRETPVEDLIQQVLGQLGPEQWTATSSLWVAEDIRLGAITSLTRRNDNEIEKDLLAYRDWLFEGPPSLFWDDDEGRQHGSPE